MAALVRWEPFRDLASLQSEVGRLMNGLMEGPGRTPQSWVPALDVWETENEVVYAFDLPGIEEEKISLEVSEDTLTVSAEREKVAEVERDRFYRYERRYGQFSRAVGLPQGADPAKITADYTDGVLKVRVPKPEATKPRKIELGTQRADVEGTATEA